MSRLELGGGFVQVTMSSDLDMMADSAAMTREEMNVLYSSSCWCRRMSPHLVVDHYCNLALTGLVGGPSGCTVASGVVGVVVVVGVCNRCQMRTSKCTCLIFGVSIGLDPG